MVRLSRWSPAISAVSAVFAAACATLPPAGPTHFYASWSGDHRPTQPVFDALDARLRAEPAFVRDFSEPMNVHLADGVPLSKGRSRYLVRITIPPRLSNRRIGEGDQTLAEFSVTCDPDRPAPCVDAILARARLQPARLRRIVARAPKA